MALRGRAGEGAGGTDTCFCPLYCAGSAQEVCGGGGWNARRMQAQHAGRVPPEARIVTDALPTGALASRFNTVSFGAQIRPLWSTQLGGIQLVCFARARQSVLDLPATPAPASMSGTLPHSVRSQKDSRPDPFCYPCHRSVLSGKRTPFRPLLPLGKV